MLTLVYNLFNPNEVESEYLKNVCHYAYLDELKEKFEDIRKTNKERDTEQFNCCGYAFGLYVWILPINILSEDEAKLYEESEETELYFDEFKEMLYCEQYNHRSILNLMTKRIVENIPNVRVISSAAEVTKEEYVVGMRGSSQGDFHFIKIDNSVISHKMGRSKIKTEVCQEDAWGYRYDSETIYFAVKRKEECYE